MDFIVPSTIDTAKALLGVKVIYNDDGQIYSGYIVETEAYLGFDDRAAHGFGVNKLLRLHPYTNVVARFMDISCTPIY